MNIKLLNTKTAQILSTPEHRVLFSYTIPVAIYVTSSNTLYELARGTSERSRTTSSHITKFKNAAYIPIDIKPIYKTAEELDNYLNNLM